MKTAVETIFRGKERTFNRRFLQMCSHYLIEPTACTPESGWEKGQVEKNVQDSVSRPRPCRLTAAQQTKLDTRNNRLVEVCN